MSYQQPASHIFVVVCLPCPQIEAGGTVCGVLYFSGRFLRSTHINHPSPPPSEECDIALELRSFGLGNAGEEARTARTRACQSHWPSRRRILIAAAGVD